MPTSAAEYQKEVADLRKCLQLQELISDISTLLINLPAHEVDGQIDCGLQRIVEFLGVDRSGFAHFSEDRRELYHSHSYTVPGIPPSPAVFFADLWPWYAGKLRNCEIVSFASPSDLPEEAVAEKAYCQQVGLKSHLCIPVAIAGSLLCAIGFASFRNYRSWPEPFVEQFRRVAEIFAHAIYRKRTEEKLQRQYASLESQYQYERIISDLSARFVKLHAEEIDGEIKTALQQIVDFFNIDRCGLLQVFADTHEVKVTHACHAAGLTGMPEEINYHEYYPWSIGKVLRGETISIHIDDLPSEALTDRQSAEQAGVRSRLLIPITANGSVDFLMSMSSVRTARVWPQELIARFRLIGEIFVNALVRQQAESRFRKLIESAPNAMIISDRLGKITLVNAQTEKLFGYMRGELLGREFEVLIPMPYRDQHAQNLPGYYADPQARPMGVTRDLLGLRKDGSTVPIEVSLGPIQVPEGIVVMATILDITDRKHAEEALQKSYRQIKQLKERLQAEADYLHAEIKTSQRYGELMCESAAMRRVLNQVEQVAPTSSSVLICGETGTGKELIAAAIHNLSPRKGRLMVKVNCAALPPSLIESELFGREKGAFTGALTKQIGRFELADGSTLFLDEIGELSMELQAKLLRVLQEGEFERLGSPKTLKVDVRVLAATNRDLTEALRNGSFREDLYYRLNVFPIIVPPLRERFEDISPLVWTFLKEFGDKMGKKIPTVKKKTMEELQRYHWPGNIRELRNVIEHAVISSPGNVLQVRLPQEEHGASAKVLTLKDSERQHITDILKMTQWRIKGHNGAAELLGLEPSTLYGKMKKLGIPNRKEKDQIQT